MHRFEPAMLMSKWAHALGLPDDPARRASIADEQLRMVWAHARAGTLVATAFAVLIALQLRGGAIPALAVDVWLGAKLVVALVRVLQGQIYLRRDRPGGVAWRRATQALLALDGAVWGAAGLLLAHEAIPLMSLVGAVLACVACVATFGLQVSFAATAAYTVPILAPTALGLLTRGDEFGWIGGIGLALLLVLQLVTGVRSQQRMVENALLRLHAEALAQEKDEALTLALRQSAVKTQFLANMSHELRTPLHGILGIARLIHLEAHDAAVARRVELIEASGTHLLSLINDMLDLSRVESGRVAMRSETFDLVAQVENVADVHSVRAGDKGLQFALTLNLEQPCRVTGDPSRFRQVLHNLLGNAIKFTRRGSISLAVGRGDDPEMIAVRVTDTGTGIAEEELPHIFEAFRQVGQAVASLPQEGVGLGLTIAREIARAMGGDITVASTLGAGTTMSFTARLPPAPAEEPADADESAPLLDPSALTERACHVLIAEDDDVNALIATAYVEYYGFQVERVRDGKEAVRHALREVRRPNLILMDCRMPVMDGFAATREIRAQERTLGLARVPVIALTATASEADRRLCLDAGMDDYLSKPFTRDGLAKLIDVWTGSRPLPAEGNGAR